MKTIVLFGFVLGALSAASKVVFVNPRQKVTLQCGVNAFKTLEWHHGDDLIQHIPLSGGFPRKGRAEIVTRAKVRQLNLEIDPVEERDAGKFICKADGRRQEQTLLVVTVWVSPPNDLQLGTDASLHCGVKGLDQEPAVQWRRPDGREHSGSLKSVTRQDAGTWVCTVSHDGATHKQDLTIKIQEPAPKAPPSTSQSPKDAGTATCSDCSAVSPPPSPPLLLLGLGWWVWVAVGVGCLVVVLLVVLVIVLCQRIKRKKRKVQAMKNGRKQMTPKKYCQCGCPAAAAKTRQGRRREKQPPPPLQPLLML